MMCAAAAKLHSGIGLLGLGVKFCVSPRWGYNSQRILGVCKQPHVLPSAGPLNPLGYLAEPWERASKKILPVTAAFP